MEKPIDVIESGEYIEPNQFATDGEATLFYSYLELSKYIEVLEAAINK